MRVWRTGDEVRVTYEGHTVDAMITFASSNGRSLMLEFKALLGGYAGIMPVLHEEDSDSFRCLLAQRPVLVTDRLDMKST